MQATQRRIDPGVVQQLLEDPHRFQFFQALRILEQLFVRQGTSHDEVVPHRLRFRNTLSLSFPASDFDVVAAYSTDGDLLDRSASIAHAVATETIGSVELTPSFMGLLGTMGALPTHYTELLASRELYNRDRAARMFLDTFTNRAVALHYGAWKKYRLALQYELDRRERFLPLVLSLSGVGMPGLRDRMLDGKGDVFDQAVAHYAGAIRQHPVSAILLQRVLADYFSADIAVEQFVGAWYRVPDAQVSRLGVGNARLGSTALAGDRVWQRDLRLRMMIGPLQRDAFEAFLPGGTAALALSKWLTLLTGSCLEYEVRLVLKAEDVKPVGVGKGLGARLGWDSYLCSCPSDRSRSDTRYFIHTLH